nr:MAG TPA: hypothetical protein [Bacteriophage sp.]
MRRAISRPSRRVFRLALAAWARHFAIAVCR